MEVVVGTYEHTLLGYRLVKDGQNLRLDPSFTDQSHLGSIRSVAISSKNILASGGTDETIRLFHLDKRQELGCLMQHSGTVNWLAFYEGSHMFSCSDDQTVCIWKSNKWECLRTFKGHKNVVRCVAVHPSGKLAMSVGSDRKLHTWNLVTGRSAYITNLKADAEMILWSPSGNHYVIINNMKIDVYDVETASVLHSIISQQRVHSAVFVDGEVIAYGGDGGKIELHNIVNDEHKLTIDTETNRLKALTLHHMTHDDSVPLLFTGSSSGHLLVYKIQKDGDKYQSKLVAKQDTKLRITCIAVTPFVCGVKVERDTTESSSVSVGKKRKLDSTKEKVDVSKDSDNDSSGAEHSGSSDAVHENCKVFIKIKKKNFIASKSSKAIKEMKDHKDSKAMRTKNGDSATGKKKGSEKKKKKLKTNQPTHKQKIFLKK